MGITKEDFAKQFAENLDKHVLITDYDGTLAALTTNPEESYPDKQALLYLLRLHKLTQDRYYKSHVFFITGRPYQQLKRLLKTAVEQLDDADPVKGELKMLMTQVNLQGAAQYGFEFFSEDNVESDQIPAEEFLFLKVIKYNSDEFVQAVEAIINRYAPAAGTQADRCTPMLEKKHGSIVLSWRHLRHRIKDLSDDVLEVMNADLKALAPRFFMAYEKFSDSESKTHVIENVFYAFLSHLLKYKSPETMDREAVFEIFQGHKFFELKLRRCNKGFVLEDLIEKHGLEDMTLFYAGDDFGKGNDGPAEEVINRQGGMIAMVKHEDNAGYFNKRRASGQHDHLYFESPADYGQFLKAVYEQALAQPAPTVAAESCSDKPRRRMRR